MGTQDEAQRQSYGIFRGLAVARFQTEHTPGEGSPSAGGFMSFLLDTNVVSEWIKPRPDLGVVEWLANVDEDSVYVSVVTFTELRHGIERLSPGKRRTQLDQWLRADLPLRFEHRILPVDAVVADQWG